MLLYWFLLSECPYKKGLLPPAMNSGGIGESGRAGHFSCLDLKSGFWQIKMEEASKQYTTFTVGNLGIFQMQLHTLWAMQHASHISATDAELSQ